MEEFLAKVRKLWDQKSAVDLLKEQLAEASKKFEAMKRDALKLMEVSELEKQHVPGCGTIYRQKEFSVKIPKDPEAKALLFGWIATNKGQDVLDNMISIHSNSLNAFYKAELAVAKEVGNVNFALPGIELPEVYWKLGMKSS